MRAYQRCVRVHFDEVQVKARPVHHLEIWIETWWRLFVHEVTVEIEECCSEDSRFEVCKWVLPCTGYGTHSKFSKDRELRRNKELWRLQSAGWANQPVRRFRWRWSWWTKLFCERRHQWIKWWQQLQCQLWVQEWMGYGWQSWQCWRCLQRAQLSDCITEGRSSAWCDTPLSTGRFLQGLQ